MIVYGLEISNSMGGSYILGGKLFKIKEKADEYYQKSYVEPTLERYKNYSWVEPVIEQFEDVLVEFEVED
jgi:hypothetical protein